MSVFLSSTSVDLAEHRRAVKEGLDRIGERVLRMETFGARPDEPTRASLSEVAECDIFVGVYAHRYGYVPPGAHASVTEMEYERALELGKPVLGFVMDDDYEWKPSFIEDEPGRARLAALKRRLYASHTIERFTSPCDLALKVSTSVGNHFSRQVARPRGRRALERRIRLPATQSAGSRKVPAASLSMGLEKVALLHTSFRSLKADERFRDGRRYYQFEVVVVAPDSVMEKITSVTYHLGEAWPETIRTQVIRDRESRFKMKELANGTSIVTAAIEIEGQGQPLRLNRFIDLRTDGPPL